MSSLLHVFLLKNEDFDRANLFQNGLSQLKPNFMRFAFGLVLLLASLGLALADPPEIDSASPDKAWTIAAHWIKRGAFPGDGYDWDLKNVKTGKIYFHEDVRKDEPLPRYFSVHWSPDSHYAALDIYYGRAVQRAMVIWLNVSNPQLIDATGSDSRSRMEQTLLRSEDLALYTGFDRSVTAVDHWINNTDLSVELDMRATLSDQKADKEYLLNTTWHKIVRFDGDTCKIIGITCDSYEKE